MTDESGAKIIDTEEPLLDDAAPRRPASPAPMNFKPRPRPLARRFPVIEMAREGTYWVARIWFRGVFYSNSLRGRRPQALTLIPEENWPGSSDREIGRAHV